MSRSIGPDPRKRKRAGGVHIHTNRRDALPSGERCQKSYSTHHKIRSPKAPPEPRFFTRKLILFLAGATGIPPGNHTLYELLQMYRGAQKAYWDGIVAICNRLAKPPITNPFEEKVVVPFSKTGLAAFKASIVRGSQQSQQSKER
ncbi:MAG: hypothetical protein Q4C96_02075 [Planctomycetia bacterium]|nr:hypothetical protein [Planctomycetia bacterium]